MSDKSAIEWTDASWNPVRGCTKVSPGCAHCYAETFAERFRGVSGHPYEQGFDLRLVPEKLTDPLRWKKPRRVFMNSMSDLFQDGVPDSYIDQVFAVMALPGASTRATGRYTPHTFQILTKRPARMLAYLTHPDRKSLVQRAALLSVRERGATWGTPYMWPLPNVWLGVSVENQHFADERIPLLLQTPAAVRFISAEPLLGHVDIEGALRGYPRQTSERRYVTRDMAIDAGDRALAGSLYSDEEWEQTSPALNWVIIGGESGPGARPMDLAWARAIVQQCQAADVPVFVKQLGANPVETSPACGGVIGRTAYPLDRLRSPKGGDMNEFPSDLRVREFPRVEMPA